MQLRWRKLANLSGFVILFGFLSILLSCARNGGVATAVPLTNKPALLVFYTDN